MERYRTRNGIVHVFRNVASVSVARLNTGRLRTLGGHFRGVRVSEVFADPLVHAGGATSTVGNGHSLRVRVLPRVVRLGNNFIRTGPFGRAFSDCPRVGSA